MKGLAVDMFCPSRPFTLCGRRLTGRLRSFTDLKTGTETRFDFTSSAMLAFKGQPHRRRKFHLTVHQSRPGQNEHTCLVRTGKGCYAEPGAPLLISLPLDTGTDEMCKRDELLQTLFTQLGMQRSLRLLLCIVSAVLTLATKQMIDAAFLEFINTLD